jgi:IS1 family transposase
MNKLTVEKRTQVIGCLVEGNSLRATARMAGVSLNTVTKLLGDMGVVCSTFQDRVMRDLPCHRVQVDEIWSFCYAKNRNGPAEKRGTFGYGDVWTWVAIDADTKLVPSYLIGSREHHDAIRFIGDLAKRLRNRVQLTTDGHRAYLVAVRKAFGNDIDYAQLIKLYGTDQDPKKPDKRYSPGVCIDAVPTRVSGNPDPDHISTSYIERQNLTMRMSMRRFTRLTNAFSKKVENLAAAVSLHFMHYNFCRVHKSLNGQTPAMAAGLTDHVWKLAELVAMLEQAETAVPMKRGPYKPRKARAISN